MVYVTWLGTAGILLSDHETNILIDPYVSRYGLLKIFCGFPLPPKTENIKTWMERLGLLKNPLNAVCVSHSHFDHCLDAPFFAKEASALLMGSESTMNVGRGAGLAENSLRRVDANDTIDIGAFSLKFIQSAHGPALLGRVPYPGFIDKPLAVPQPAKSYKLGQTFSILVSHPAGTIVHHGSAGFIPGMYEGEQADAVLLGIAGRGDTDAYLKHVPLALQAKRLIPIHFDNFFLPLEKPLKKLPGVRFQEFVASAQKYQKDFALRVLPVGERTLILPADQEISRRVRKEAIFRRLEDR